MTSYHIPNLIKAFEFSETFSLIEKDKEVLKLSAEGLKYKIVGNGKIINIVNKKNMSPLMLKDKWGVNHVNIYLSKVDGKWLFIK